MFLRYLLAVLLGLIVITSAVLLIVFLASAAIFGSFFLPFVCIVAMVLFFYGLSSINEKQEV